MAYAAGAAGFDLRKRFFFEKKKQKTFDTLGLVLSMQRALICKSSLVLSFKKELLPP
jgi:hypothetical protein